MYRLLIVVVFAFFVTACAGAIEEASERIAGAGSGGEADFEIEDGQVSVSFDNDDTAFQSGSDVEFPDELTFPHLDGGRVTTRLTQGSYVSAALQYPIGRYDEIVTLYGDFVAADSREWSESESVVDMGGLPMRNMTWIAGSSAIIVNDCMSLEGELELACVSLNESS